MAFSGTDATTQTRDRSATVITGAAVSLRYSPGATANSVTSPSIGSAQGDESTRPLKVHTQQLQSRRHIVLGRARLFERGGRLRERRFRRDHFLLRDGTIGQQIANPAHVGFGLRDSGLPVLYVGLCLAERREQSRAFRCVDGHERLPASDMIAKRDEHLADTSGHGQRELREPRRNGVDFARKVELVDGERGRADLDYADAFELWR